MNGQIQYGPVSRLTSELTRRATPRRLAEAARFGPHRSRAALLVSAAALLVGALAALPRGVPVAAVGTVLGSAWLALVLAMTLPAARERAGAELTRRLGAFRHAVNSAGDAPTRDELLSLLQLARDLGLHETEIREDLEQIEAALTALALREQVERGELPIVPAATPFPPGDTCHFSSPARRGRRRADCDGHLLMTGNGLTFHGDSDVQLTWSDVARVERAGREIVVALQNSRRVFRFECPTLDVAARGSVIADHFAAIADQPQVAPPLLLQEAAALASRSCDATLTLPPDGRRFVPPGSPSEG